MKSAPENNYQTIITGYSSCPKERVIFVLNPPKTYTDAFSECLNERTQDARYAKKKSNSLHRKSTEEYDYLFWTIIKIAILMAFSSGGNV